MVALYQIILIFSLSLVSCFFYVQHKLQLIVGKHVFPTLMWSLILYTTVRIFHFVNLFSTPLSLHQQLQRCFARLLWCLPFRGASTRYSWTHRLIQGGRCNHDHWWSGMSCRNYWTVTEKYLFWDISLVWPIHVIVEYTDLLQSHIGNQTAEEHSSFQTFFIPGNNPTRNAVMPVEHHRSGDEHSSATHAQLCKALMIWGGWKWESEWRRLRTKVCELEWQPFSGIRRNQDSSKLNIIRGTLTTVWCTSWWRRWE